MNVGVFIYDKAEELDFVGPYEVFQAAGLDVFTVAESADPISTAGGLRVLPHHTFADHPPIDIVVVPGGDSRAQVASETVEAWLREVAEHTTVTTSVCTGAYILGKAGLLAGRKATTHWMSLDRLAAAHPDVDVQRDVRWVDEGAVVTGAGVSAGIDMALHVVSRLLGREAAEKTAAYMEYRWDENPAR